MYKFTNINNNINGDIMKNEMYDEIVKKYTPKEDVLKNAIVTFLAGGTIGALSELLLVGYSTWLNIPRKESGVLVILTLIFISSILTA